MANIKKILFIALFGAPLPTFSMEPEAPEIHVLDDGQEWLIPRRSEHLDQFMGNIIAVRPPGKKTDERAYQINSGPIIYALVAEEDPIDLGYQMAILKYVIKRECSGQIVYSELTSKDLRSKDFPMRLLTVDEACHLATAAEDGQLIFWAWDLSNFKLSNLAPKERRRYVREHGHEHEELKYIQTLCGIRQKRQRETALDLFPRDIFKMILRHVVDGEIAQNGNLLLNFQKPKQPWFPECVVL